MPLSGHTPGMYGRKANGGVSYRVCGILKNLDIDLTHIDARTLAEKLVAQTADLQQDDH